MDINDETSNSKIEGLNSNSNILFMDATGFSMWPFIKHGNKLLIKKIPIRDSRTGDVILYQANGNLVCHRLVKKISEGQRQMLYVRGDNSLKFEPITEEMFQGKVIGILKNGRIVNLVGWRQQFINQLIILISPFFGIIARFCKVLLGKQ